MVPTWHDMTWQKISTRSLLHTTLWVERCRLLPNYSGPYSVCMHSPKNNGFFGATCIISPQRVCIIGFCQSLFKGFLTGGLESESAKGAIIEAPKAPGGVCLSTGSGLWGGALILFTLKCVFGCNYPPRKCLIFWPQNGVFWWNPRAEFRYSLQPKSVMYCNHLRLPYCVCEFSGESDVNIKIDIRRSSMYAG